VRRWRRPALVAGGVRAGYWVKTRERAKGKVVQHRLELGNRRIDSDI